ncbi:MAG TPA: TIGR03013 family PEP-CTERM/XrtA system glycosyltransferase [Steroidobacteraceae bacterium]|nr:TIGR03013 family PEP-CTERM/XrtA system glycosyltransferase [Steroidobacteraceae bacterium]
MSTRLFGVVWYLPLLLLAVVEVAALVSAYLIAVTILQSMVSSPAFSWQGALLFALITLVAFAGLGLFSRRQRANRKGIMLRVAVGIMVGAMVSWVLARWLGWPGPSVPQLVIAATIAVFLTVLLRLLAEKLVSEDVFRRRVIVFGGGQRAASIAGLRRRVDQRGFKLLGFLPSEGEAAVVDAARMLPGNRPLLDLARELQADEIVVAMDDRRRSFPIADLLECRFDGIEVTELVTFLERETGKVHLDVLNPSWLIFGAGFRRDHLRLASERALDLFACVALLLLVWPLMLLTAIAIMLEDGPRAPIFYRQTRVGFRGKNFQVIKFRSMRVDAEKAGAQWAQANDTRVTRVGAIIRKLRIDELPQLINVLRGDMSFVGPRPERPEFVANLSAQIPYYQERHFVKPGITGWAQVCYPYGASETDAAEKLQYDLYYVKNHSLLFDIMILLQTAEVVLLGKGAR